MKLYRIPTNLLPFPTHPITKEWNWRQILEPCFEYTGNLAREMGIRISFHADEYTIVNSPIERVFTNSADSLVYLADVLDMMRLDGNIVIHVGGVYKDKEGSLERFVDNFSKLPQHVRTKLIIENDDKQYSWSDVFRLCERLKLPQVLDIHHYRVFNPEGKPLVKEEINRIFSTWDTKKPKIHLSSPKTQQEPRAHAEYVDIEDFLWFYRLSEEFDYDIMLEAKAKELAVVEFRNQLKSKGITLSVKLL